MAYTRSRLVSEANTAMAAPSTPTSFEHCPHRVRVRVSRDTV
ncbi:hypothetical protein [Rhodococcus sp. ZPP]|nr:hypothetical protein [Rhodococcus sp. ZPP]